MSLHIVFDDTESNGASPKDIERLRRDKKRKCSCLNDVDVDTTVPKHWREFLSNRHKRLLCNFLCVYKYVIESRLNVQFVSQMLGLKLTGAMVTMRVTVVFGCMLFFAMTDTVPSDRIG
jgi:hypothetical protein